MTGTTTFAASDLEVGATSIRDRIRELLDQAGLARSTSWVHRVSRDFARLGVGRIPLGLFVSTRIALTVMEQRRLAADRRLAESNDPDLRYIAEYRDPTGETAIHNVMRERGF